MHWKAVIQILMYLKGNSKLALVLGGANPLTLHAYSDADWAGDTDRRRSRTGYCIFLGSSLIVWCSKLQLSTALSTMEAEYMALSATCQDVIWLRKLISEMGHRQNQATTVYEDNTSCMAVASSESYHPGIRHIDIRYHFIQDRITEIKDIALEYKPTGEMIADLFTKQLPFPAFSRHRHALGLSAI